MDNKVLKQRKTEVEKEFNKLQETKKQLFEKQQAIQKSMAFIKEEETKLRGAYTEICNFLGVDPKDAKNLSIKPKPSPEKKK